MGAIAVCGFKLILILICSTLLALGSFLGVYIRFLSNLTGGSVFTLVITVWAIIVFMLAGLLGIFGTLSESKILLTVNLVFSWIGFGMLLILTIVTLSMRSSFIKAIDGFIFEQMNLYGLEPGETAMVNDHSLTPDSVADSNMFTTLETAFEFYGEFDLEKMANESYISSVMENIQKTIAPANAVLPNMDTKSSLLVNTVHHVGKCCGYDDYEDWAKFPYARKNFTEVPVTCCKDLNDCTGSTNDDIFEKGCSNALREEFSNLYQWFIVASAISAVVVLVAASMATCLRCAEKEYLDEYTHRTDEIVYR